MLGIERVKLERCAGIADVRIDPAARGLSGAALRADTQLDILGSDRGRRRAQSHRGGSIRSSIH